MELEDVGTNLFQIRKYNPITFKNVFNNSFNNKSIENSSDSLLSFQTDHLL